MYDARVYRAEQKKGKEGIKVEIKWAVLFMCFAILVMTLVEFIALDRKIQRAIEQQGEINQRSYYVNKEQAESIRMLKTDTQILMNIAVNGDYNREEEDVGD